MRNRKIYNPLNIILIYIIKVNIKFAYALK